MTERISFVAFCITVLGLEMSLPWRVLLLVSVDVVEPGQLAGEEREIARRLFGDVDVVPEDARRALVWRLGRGSGKTTFAAALGLWSMLTADVARVGPGMVPAAVVVAPTRRTATIAVRVARALVRGVPSLERLVLREGDNSEGFHLRRPDGRTVAFAAVAASRGGASLRGFDILLVVLDESEFFSSNDDVASSDGYLVSDRDLYAAAKPRLIGQAVFISTPWPTENLTAELFAKNHEHPKDALAAIGASMLMRPSKRLERDIAAELERDEENAKREYFCEQTSATGARLFDGASIDAAVVAGRPLVVLAPPGSVVGAGGDLGFERDSSAIGTVHNAGSSFELLELDEQRPTKDAPLVPSRVIAHFATVMRRHGVGMLMADSHYRQSVIENLESHGMSFKTAPEGMQGKFDTYMFVRALLREGKLRLPPLPRLLSQLRGVTQTHLPGGGTKISSPRRMRSGGHGDLVSALVLAVWSAKEGSQQAAGPEPITGGWVVTRDVESSLGVMSDAFLDGLTGGLFHGE